MFQFIRTEYQQHLLGQRPTSCRGGERPHGLLDWTEYTGQEVKAVEAGNDISTYSNIGKNIGRNILLQYVIKE